MITGPSSLLTTSWSRLISSCLVLRQFNVGDIDVFENRVDPPADLCLGVVEEIGDRFLGADQRDDLYVRPNTAQVVQCEHVQRVGHGHEQPPSQAGDGDHLVGLAKIFRDEVDDILGNAHLGERDRVRAETAAHADHHVLFGDQLLFQQQLQQPAALFLLNVEDFVELLFGKQPIRQQCVGDSFSE